MASKEQIAANRRNAQHSTGPRTPEGKARTAQNARTHALMSGELRTPFEEEDQLISHAQAIHEHYYPQSEPEFILVEQIVSATWRLRRIRRIETRHYRHRADDLRENRERSGDQFDDETQVFRDDCNGPKILETLGRHEARLERSFYRALHELEHIQSRRPDPPPQNSQDQPISGVEPELQNQPNLPQLADPEAQPDSLPIPASASVLAAKTTVAGRDGRWTDGRAIQVLRRSA
jgi:hypothetical protein